MPVERWTDELDGLATSVADLRIAAVSLLETATHQQGLEVSQRIQTIPLRMEQMQSQVRDMQSEIRGLQTENRRILDILSQQDNDN